MAKKTLHIVSAMDGSIGEITKDLIPYLNEAFDVSIEGDEDPKGYDILLSHFVNVLVTEADSFDKFKTKILIQPIDGTSITRKVILALNRYDLIITPGEAGKKIMIEQGVKTPIVVIRNFYKDDMFTLPKSLAVEEIPKDKIVFYHESTCHPRKGIEFMYEGFIKAFSDTEYADKVVLVVKDSAFNEITFDRIEKLKEDTIALQKQYKKPVSIIKISQKLKEDTLKKLWHHANIYVSLAKIEGFGIPLLRMALLKKPILALDSPVCGYMDWLNEDNSYLVPSKLIENEDEFMFLYKEDSKWSVPCSIEDVIEGFRTSLKDYIDNSYKTVDLVDLKEMHINKIAEKYIATIEKTFNNNI